MNETNPKHMKRFLKALKSLSVFALRDCYYGLAAFKFEGNRVSYSSRHGATVGVYMPEDLGLSEPLYVPALKVKLALQMNPAEFAFDPVGMSLNGVVLSRDESRNIAADLPLDFRDRFGVVVCPAMVPIPKLRKDIGVAKAQGDIRAYLNGICYDLDGHAVIATDGHRMHLANSDTLPTYDALTLQDLRRKFKNPHAEPDQRPVRVVLATWMDSLLETIDATEFGVARFPDLQPGEAKVLGGWGYPDPDSFSLILNATSDIGFLVGATFDGQFPDWPRVVPSLNAIGAVRANVVDGERKLPQLQSEASRTPYDTSLPRKIQEAKDWRLEYPRKMRFAETTVATLRVYAKARLAEVKTEKSKNPVTALAVTLDFKQGLIQGDPLSAVKLSVPFEVMEDVVYLDSEERDMDHIAGLNAIYLADAIEYMGSSAEWYGAQKHAFVSHDAPRSAVVMTCRV